MYNVVDTLVNDIKREWTTDCILSIRLCRHLGDEYSTSIKFEDFKHIYETLSRSCIGTDNTNFRCKYDAVTEYQLPDKRHIETIEQEQYGTVCTVRLKRVYECIKRPNGILQVCLLSKTRSSVPGLFVPSLITIKDRWVFTYTGKHKHYYIMSKQSTSVDRQSACELPPCFMIDIETYDNDAIYSCILKACDMLGRYDGDTRICLEHHLKPTCHNL